MRSLRVWRLGRVEYEDGLGLMRLAADAERRVVLEAEVERAPDHGRLAADRVAVDVERVRLVLHVLETGEEHRVEQRGRHLRDAAAEVLDVLLSHEGVYDGWGAPNV